MKTDTVGVQSVIEAGKLIGVDDAIKILETTEPMVEHEFELDGTSHVKFTMPDGWNDSFDEMDADDSTGCTINVEGIEVDLSKEALLTMTSAVGLQKPYVAKTPGPLIQPHLNYWVNNNGVAQTDGMRLMVKNNLGVGFIRSSLATFPNIPLVEKVIERASEKYQTDEFYFDYKIEHNLERTALRLIVPSYVKTIESARSGSQADDWSVGIQIINSLTGHPQSRLSVSGYLFAWWCTNGSISQHATSGNYNRRVQGQDFDEIMSWIGASTDNIFNELTMELSDVEALTEISLAGELNDVVTDIFNELKVPKNVRKSIVNTLIDSDDLSGYGLMQAITQAANDPDVTDKVRENTMVVGGAIPHILSDRCEECHRVKVN